MNNEEKLKEAKRLYQTANSDQRYVLESLFTELKESEDEKTRKTLLEYFNAYPKDYFGGLKKSYIVAWLEKQEGCENIKKGLYGKYIGGTFKEWTTSDAATLKELIDFLENGIAKLQHDLTRYANWLKTQFTSIEKKSEQKQTDKIEPIPERR